jgi:4-diphosphocytidyl-2-C-methyl-D-erythritol kinase
MTARVLPMSIPQQRFAAPAKINLGLRILGKRPDGYHAIETLFQMLDLCDWLSFRIHAAEGIRLRCTSPTLPVDDGNLIVRAAKLLQQTMPVPQGADITLDKHIPIAAGLGGGSSDAATTLLVLNHLWRLHHNAATLHGLAAQLGSDVPFFLNGPTALASGRGEILTAVPPLAPFGGILVHPGFGVSAAWAYGQFSGQSMATDQTVPDILQALQHQQLKLLPDRLVNDLEPGVVTVYPAVRQAQDALRAAGALVTFMSGSGPTVGGLFPLTADLRVAATSLGRTPDWTAIRFSTLSGSLHPELRG